MRFFARLDLAGKHNISRVIEGVRVTGTYIVQNGGCQGLLRQAGILTLTTALTKSALAYIMLHQLFEDAQHKDGTTP